MGAKVYNDLPLEVRKTVNLKLPSIESEYASKTFYFMGTKVYNDLPLEVKLSIFMGAKVCNDLLLEVGKILNFSDSEKFINILTSEPLLLGFYCYCWRCLARARTNIKKKTRRKLYIIVIDKACEKLAKFEVSFSDRHWLSACFGFCIYRNIDRKRQTYR